jgi:hypothetical protein
MNTAVAERVYDASAVEALLGDSLDELVDRVHHDEIHFFELALLGATALPAFLGPTVFSALLGATVI